ncbi:hypothetical protein CEXT_356951 [Caerostris extrusa]|uniref:Uncharacterized protein n=1 Tax=Caerostris extrusa TaxID=172846 RepID=A0AAV4SNU7_CAEEX|nr:hypothetical protein CEXT_356951 [Caerostris extrusa]
MLSQNHSFARVSECSRNWQREKEVLLHFSHLCNIYSTFLKREKAQTPRGKLDFSEFWRAQKILASFSRRCRDGTHPNNKRTID